MEPRNRKFFWRGFVDFQFIESVLDADDSNSELFFSVTVSSFFKILPSIEAKKGCQQMAILSLLE